MDYIDEILATDAVFFGSLIGLFAALVIDGLLVELAHMRRTIAKLNKRRF